MEERKLEVFNFFISPRNSKKREKLSLHDLEGFDLLELVHENFVEFIDLLPADDRTQRVVSLGKDEVGKAAFRYKGDIRSVTGIIETGNYGKEQKVVDKDNKEEGAVYTIEKHQAVSKPFFYLICIPNNGMDGFLILEKNGTDGIKGVFQSVLKSFIRKYFEEVSVHYSQYIDDAVAEQYVNKGEYKEIILTRDTISNEISNVYGIKKLQTEDFQLELKIKAKRGSIITGNARQKIKDIFKYKMGGFFSIQDFDKLGFDDNAKIKVVSDFNNEPRTIDLSDTMKFKPMYKIMVRINAKGETSFGSIEGETITLLEGLELGLW